MNFYSRSNLTEAKRFISVALHLREFFNLLWQEYMVPSDAPHPNQDRNGEREAADWVLGNTCRRREVERAKRLSVVDELALNNDFTKELSSHLSMFLKGGGVVDGLDKSPLFDKSCECISGMKAAITGIDNFCIALSDNGDEMSTVGSIFSRLRTCYAYDCFKHHSALGYSLRSRLDRLLWKLIAPLYEISCRGSSQSSIWGSVESVLWARKASHPPEPFWPGLCLGVLTSPSQKSRNKALIDRNEIVLSSRVRLELLDAQQQIDKSPKCESFYLVESLEDHTLSWVPKKDVRRGFDGTYDPNKESSRTVNIVTSPIFIRAFQKGEKALGEEKDKAYQFLFFTGKGADENRSYSFDKLATATGNVDRTRGCAKIQEISSISWEEEANCLLASEGLLDYSTFGHDEQSTKRPFLHNLKQTDREFGPLELQRPSEKRLRSTVHVAAIPHVAGRQNCHDDRDVASIARKPESCTTGKEACRSVIDVAAPPITNCNKCSQSIPNTSPLKRTARVVPVSNSTGPSEGIQIHDRPSTRGKQTNSHAGKRHSQPISPATDMGAALLSRESFLANPAGDMVNPAGDNVGPQRLPDTFMAHARKGQELCLTNVRLWKKYAQLKQKLAALEEKHRKKVAAYNVFLDQEKLGEDDSVAIANSASTDPELKELSPQTSVESCVAFFMDFSNYIQKAVDQNAMLVSENDKLQEKISRLQVRHNELKEKAARELAEFFESQ